MWTFGSPLLGGKPLLRGRFFLWGWVGRGRGWGWGWGWGRGRGPAVHGVHAAGVPAGGSHGSRGLGRGSRQLSRGLVQGDWVPVHADCGAGVLRFTSAASWLPAHAVHAVHAAGVLAGGSHGSRGLGRGPVHGDWVAVHADCGAGGSCGLRGSRHLGLGKPVLFTAGEEDFAPGLVPVFFGCVLSFCSAVKVPEACFGAGTVVGNFAVAPICRIHRRSTYWAAHRGYGRGIARRFM